MKYLVFTVFYVALAVAVPATAKDRKGVEQGIAQMDPIFGIVPVDDYLYMPLHCDQTLAAAGECNVEAELVFVIDRNDSAPEVLPGDTFFSFLARWARGYGQVIVADSVIDPLGIAAELGEIPTVEEDLSVTLDIKAIWGEFDYDPSDGLLLGSQFVVAELNTQYVSNLVDPAQSFSIPTLNEFVLTNDPEVAEQGYWVLTAVVPQPPTWYHPCNGGTVDDRLSPTDPCPPYENPLYEYATGGKGDKSVGDDVAYATPAECASELSNCQHRAYLNYEAGRHQCASTHMTWTAPVLITCIGVGALCGPMAFVCGGVCGGIAGAANSYANHHCERARYYEREAAESSCSSNYRSCCAGNCEDAG